MFADNVVRALFPVGGQVVKDQVVTGQTLVSWDTSAVENRQGEPWESARVDLVGRQIRRHADVIVVSISTWGRCKYQSSCRSLTTIASIWAIVWFTRSMPTLQLG